jgi:hypothetical protein
MPTGTPKGPARSPALTGPAVANEAMRLYEMNADDTFERTGRLVIDSSLGLVDLDCQGPPSKRRRH